MSRRKLIVLASVLGLAGTGAAGYAWLAGGSAAEAAGRLFDALDLTPGAAVAEIGAGDGDFTFLAARRVGPGGRAYATEISAGKLKSLRERVERENAKNVTALEAGERETRLPEACCDAIFLRHVYHHFTSPEAIGASIAKSLKPGGRLAVVDFPPKLVLKPFKVKGAPANRGGHGVRPQQVAEELRAAGFEILRTEEKWDGSDFLVLARKP